MNGNFPIGKLIGLVIALPFFCTLGIVILIIVILGGSPAKDTSLGDTLAYLTPINEKAQANGVPPLWAIADIAWESGGNWRAINDNTNGTVDAGLSQINSANWPSYGLEDDPYDVNKNVGAGQKILGSAFKMYGNIEDALYAYNGGTPANGRKYNPDYVPNVTNKYNILTNSYLIISVHSYDNNSLILTIGDAQVVHHHARPNTEGGDDDTVVGFFNPSSIMVKVTDKNGLVKLNEVNVNPENGDGLSFSPEATIYKVIGTSFVKGDVVNVKAPDGKSNQISLN